MNIHFSIKEEKQNKLDEKGLNLTYCYLVAIAHQNKELWNNFKNLINMVDEVNQNETN
jgi:hypothetical protein